MHSGKNVNAVDLPPFLQPRAFRDAGGKATASQRRAALSASDTDSADDQPRDMLFGDATAPHSTTNATTTTNSSNPPSGSKSGPATATTTAPTTRAAAPTPAATDGEANGSDDDDDDLMCVSRVPLVGPTAHQRSVGGVVPGPVESAKDDVSGGVDGDMGDKGGTAVDAMEGGVAAAGDDDDFAFDEALLEEDGAAVDDSEAGRQRLMDELGPLLEGMSRAEVEELLDDYVAQRAEKRAALMARKAEAKRYSVSVKVRRPPSTQHNDDNDEGNSAVAVAPVEVALAAVGGKALSEPAATANSPPVAVAVAVVSPHTVTSRHGYAAAVVPSPSSTGIVRAARAPPLGTASTAPRAAGSADDEAADNSGSDYYAPQVTEARMQRQLEDLLEEFAGNASPSTTATAASSATATATASSDGPTTALRKAPSSNNTVAGSAISTSNATAPRRRVSIEEPSESPVAEKKTEKGAPKVAKGLRPLAPSATSLGGTGVIANAEARAVLQRPLPSVGSLPPAPTLVSRAGQRVAASVRLPTDTVLGQRRRPSPSPAEVTPNATTPISPVSVPVVASGAAALPRRVSTRAAPMAPMATSAAHRTSPPPSAGQGPLAAKGTATGGPTATGASGGGAPRQPVATAPNNPHQQQQTTRTVAGFSFVQR